MPEGRRSRLEEDDPKRDPEAILARLQRTEGKPSRGRLKIFLGFAAGVGKTFEMLNEAKRRKERGQDVVIAYVETHGRAGTVSQLGDLEVVPRRTVTYRDTQFEEMDTPAVIARKPQWALVDELAHTNVPGVEREKRWQDVEAILAAGINVLSTLNVQHLESLNDTVKDITGVRVRETVPDWFVTQADEVVMVDITPRALIHRLERGDIYKPDKVQSAKSAWFREGNLNALREIALREIASEVDEDLSTYRKEKRIEPAWATHERIMVCISPSRPSLRLIRRGWRIARRLHAEITAVFVESGPNTPQEQAVLKEDFALADRLGVPIVTLQGDVAREIERFARERQITQIVLGHSTRSRWQDVIHGSIIDRLTRSLRNVDILIVAASEDEG